MTQHDVCGTSDNDDLVIDVLLLTYTHSNAIVVQIERPGFTFYMADGFARGHDVAHVIACVPTPVRQSLQFLVKWCRYD